MGLRIALVNLFVAHLLACESLAVEDVTPAVGPDGGRVRADLGSEDVPQLDLAGLERSADADVPDGEGGDLDSEVDGGTGPELGPDLPPVFIPSEPGPHAVGVQTFTLEDPTRGRSLEVEVWYPVDAQSPDGSSNAYRLETSLGVKLAEMSSPARRDATPLGGGPYPLVVFSHGFAGIRFQSFFLTEHLASHGIVVAAPDHPGNRLTDFAQLGSDEARRQSAIDRPLDMVLVLEAMLAGDIGLALPIDPSQVIASGHSFGGWTSLEVARRDHRFSAVLSLAPGFREDSTPDFVAGLSRPVAIFGGSEDRTTPFESDQRVPYELAAPPKVLLQVLGAGHFDFSNMCDLAIARLFVDDGCDRELIDPSIVHARVRSVATAFIKTDVEGHAGYERFLTPSYVNGLGDVQFERER